MYEFFYGINVFSFFFKVVKNLHTIDIISANKACRDIAAKSKGKQMQSIYFPFIVGRAATASKPLLSDAH
ncbi:hypothetical protein AB4Z22_10165, partial [Paenibacillus sp. TAF58]